MPEPMLEIDGLDVRYGAVPAVRGATLSIGQGEIVGLVGPNGAGKSTTLLALMGAVPVADGAIGSRGAPSSASRRRRSSGRESRWCQKAGTYSIT